MIPLSMRVRDWLAGHFSFVQYAKPQRKPPRAKIPWAEVWEDLLGFGLMFCIGVAFLYRRRKDRGLQVAALFACAAMVWASTHLIVLLL